jgi:ATP-binding cassette subfamily C (CFTR/MRP) protein 1
MSRSSLKDRGGGGKAYGSIKIETESSDTFEDEPLLTRNRRDSTSIWSILAGLWRSLVFGWFTPVLKGIQEQLDLGRSPDLENEEAIPPLPKEDSTSYLTSQFEELWKKEQQTAEQPSLVPCLWKAFSPLFIQAGFLKAIHDCLQFVGPQVLNGLIQFLRTPSDSMSTGIMLTATVTVAQLCMSLCLRHYFFRCYRVSLRIRTCVLLAIYQKSLTIDPSYYQKHPVGQITNLMSVDVQRLQDVVTYLHAIWYSFLQIALAMYFLWQQLGPSCLAGVGVILASIPLTAVSAQWMGRLQKKLMEKKDDRVQTNQETIVNMKVVKLQAWEGPFRDKVKHLRRLELRQLLHYALAQACTGLMWSAVPLLIALSTFAAYVTIAGHSLDVASALTALALFEILRFPLFMLPYVINMLVEAGVALKRIEDFLSAPDHVPPPRLEDPNTVIQLSNATFSYRHVLPSTNKKNSTVQEHLEKTEEELLLIKAKLADAEEHLAELEGRPYKRYESTVGSSKRYDSGDDSGDEEKIDSAPEKLLSLRRANFECKEGEFIAIVGSVGSGKSTFLKSILGEVQRISGEVGVRGKLAYFDQKPFIMNDTVEGNVLFGKSDKDIELYKLAIQSCCLEHDLTLLPNGDQCEIGERGITLSGGQKARIAMARVVYHNADISLLDDCLSAVDAHVGRDMFDQCIINVLLQRNNENAPKRKRTVILVTNALQYLSHPMLDRIVVLKNGLVVETGSYKELLDRESSRFKSLLYAFNESMEGEYGNGSEENPMGEDVTGLNTEDAADGIDGVGEGSISELGLSERVVSSCRLLMSESVSDIEKVAGKLMTDEMAEREIGKVDREVYMTWAKAAGGLWVIIPLLLVFAAGECMSVLSNWWLTYWSHAATPDSESQMHFLGIYGKKLFCF